MKTIAVAALGILAASCALAGAQEAVMRTVDSGAYAASASPGQEALLASDAESFAALWESHVGNGAVPAIDFPRETAVLLLGGERMTGGWSVVPRSVRIENDVLIVTAVVEGPPAGSVATQALTYPWAVIAVSPGSARSVRWEAQPAR